MTRNKYVTFLVLVVFIFFAIKEQSKNATPGQKQAFQAFKENFSAGYNQVIDLVKDYRSISDDNDQVDDWATEIGLHVKPLVGNQSPGIFTEKLADMAQKFLKTRKGASTT